MKIVLNLICAVILANLIDQSQAGWCKVCPKDETNSPVCGSDDVTYSSECQLERAGCRHKKNITVANQGRCIHNVCGVCPKILLPVCGTDKVTHSSECELKRAVCLQGKPIRVAYKGKCIVCPKINQPVCGTDGKTYS